MKNKTLSLKDKIKLNDERFLEGKKNKIERYKIESRELLEKYKYDPKFITVYSPPKTRTLPKIITNLKTAEDPKIIPKMRSTTKSKNVHKDNLFTQITSQSPISYSKYRRLLTQSETKIRPERDIKKAKEFIKYINGLNKLGKNVILNEYDCLDEMENRYNREKPGEDSKITLNDKALVEHLWKNYFTLSEYQNFFLDQLKGKISRVSYADMLKEFRKISQICFYKGRVNLGLINYGLFGQY